MCNKTFKKAKNYLFINFTLNKIYSKQFNFTLINHISHLFSDEINYFIVQKTL